MARLMEISTPLDHDVLLFHGMHAREELSRLSEFQINLLSEKDSINVDDILGKAVSVALELPKGGTRYFNGFVTRFSAGGTVGRYHRYRAEVRPWLWFLTRARDISEAPSSDRFAPPAAQAAPPRTPSPPAGDPRPTES